jgi:hypothetical protein
VLVDQKDKYKFMPKPKCKYMILNRNPRKEFKNNKSTIFFENKKKIKKENSRFFVLSSDFLRLFFCCCCYFFFVFLLEPLTVDWELRDSTDASDGERVGGR